MAGQLWGVNSLGGYMYSDRLSKVLRNALQPLMKFRQLSDVKDATGQGLNKGATYRWNIYGDVQQPGGALQEQQAMPETNFEITQGSLTIGEYGNSVPYTGLLDNLSEHPVKEIINKVLRHDAKKTLDKAAYDQFAATPLWVVPTSGTSTDTVVLTTNGTSSQANGVAMGKDHVKAIVDIMKERNIPPFEGDDYISVGHPTTFRKVKNDLETIHQYVDQGFTMILNGEIGRYEGVRFVEQNNVAKETWSGQKSNWAYFCGEDTVAQAIAIPEEMRGKLPTDYGRSRGVAWYALLGFGLVHTVASQARIIKWASGGADV